MPEAVDGSESNAPGERGERLTYAARQFAVIAVGLLVLRWITATARPDDGFDDDVVSVPLSWAIVAWGALLLYYSLAFERSQIRTLAEGPLIGAGIAGALAFAIGAGSVDAGSGGDRLVYLALAGIGVALFWFPVLGVCKLLWTQTGTDPRPT